LCTEVDHLCVGHVPSLCCSLVSQVLWQRHLERYTLQRALRLRLEKAARRQCAPVLGRDDDGVLGSRHTGAFLLAIERMLSVLLPDLLQPLSIALYPKTDALATLGQRVPVTEDEGVGSGLSGGSRPGALPVLIEPNRVAALMVGRVESTDGVPTFPHACNLTSCPHSLCSDTIRGLNCYGYR
jgi:hypothetical protein